MNFKNLVIFCICVSVTSLQASALKRIKRNSLGDSKTSRVKQDFVILQTANQDSKENNYPKAESSFNSNENSANSNNISQTHSTEEDKIQKVGRPLAVILRERQHKLNEHLKGNTYKEKEANAHEENNNEKLDKRFDDPANSKELYERDNKKKHLPRNRIHSSSVVRTHQSFGNLNPFANLNQLMKFGNMMMFKVGVASPPFSDRMIMNQNSFVNSQENEPSFDYVFNSMEEPQEIYYNSKIPTRFTKEPLELTDLMENALNTILTKSANNVDEIEITCPIHHEKKSIDTKKGDNGDIIQVCSCHFIKNNKDAKKQQK
ncbi:uncharacterized protein ACRADG_007647 [Cochliomyia hominivorax]